MRIFGTLLVLGVITLLALPAQAADRPQHGRGFSSDRDDDWRPRGQGDILNFPDYHLEYDPFYWQRRDGFEFRYRDGDFDGRFRFGDRDHRRDRHYPRHRDYRYDYPPRVYYSPDGYNVQPLYGYGGGYADYYYSNIRPTDRYYYDQQDYYRQQYREERERESYRDEPPQTVNVYNNYYDQGPQPDAAAPAPQPRAEAPEEEQLPPIESGERPFGRLFYGSAMLTIGDRAYNATLSDGQLFVGPEVGPGVKVADGINAELGVLASYHPQAGLVFVFASEGKLTAAYESVSGWGLEPLPIELDLGEDVSLGQMGGFPWVVFNGTDGTRYVYSFDTSGWYQVGSATPPPAG